jgi:hypothetical protein
MPEKQYYHRMSHPIAVFGYKRPELLFKCLQSLESNDGALESDVYIFIDGPKTSSEVDLVSQCINVAEKSWRFKSKKVLVSGGNLGLRQSIVQGIDRILKIHDSIIVIEDDLQLHPKFISFISSGLDKYKDDAKVASIQGFSLIERESKQSYFLPSSDSWGWGTWKNRWDLVTWDSSYLLEQIARRRLKNRFNYNNSYNYTKLLKLNSKGKINSWAIDWQASLFLGNKFSLYPPFSLVTNTGVGTGATHTYKGLELIPVLSKKQDWSYPTMVQVNEVIYEEVCNAYSVYFPDQRFSKRFLSKIKETTRAINTLLLKVARDIWCTSENKRNLS